MMTKKPRLNLAARFFKVELSVFLQVCEEVNTPRSLTCYLLASNDEWLQYLSLEIDTASDTFEDDYLVTEMLRKNPNLPVKIDRRGAAVLAWRSAEQQCRETNDRLRRYISGTISPRTSEVSAVIHRAIEIISVILGELRPQDLSFLEKEMRFGPGATSALGGRDVIESKKYTCEKHVSSRLSPYLTTLTAFDDESKAVLVDSNKVTFVSKTSKIDRAIAIEPHMNSFVQLGTGALLRRKLKNHGLDLDRQADRNRSLASRAHLDGLATIDLSSASDTISSELVWMLLPFDWASLLFLSRVDYSTLNGEEIRLEKFSSMGNGYTFELESLIFWALSRAVGDDDAVTFGDDIIVKREFVPLLRETFDFLGFTVNAKKSFVAGDFFESCGHDYWRGIMVRPIYLKGSKYDFSSSIIRLANKLRRYSSQRARGAGCDIRFRRAWTYTVRQCNLARQTYIPSGFGDSGLIRNFDECTPALARHGHEGYIGRVLRIEMASYDVSSSLGAYRAALHRGCALMPKSLSGSRQFLRTTQGKQIIPYWNDLGPWIRICDAIT